MQLNWQNYAFEDLSTDQLYAILQLRLEVFVVEQTCYYQDLDGKDRAALHLCGYDDEGHLAAYTRILPKGISYADYASIGRVITAPHARGKGIGRPLMRESLRVLFAAYGKQAVKISAQAHLQSYYESVGFQGTGPIYDEDGIPHRAMVHHPEGLTPNEKQNTARKK
ncbi:MAG: GNAT family N-acetyltransferase [Bacteroidota bacterium]